MSRALGIQNTGAPKKLIFSVKTSMFHGMKTLVVRNPEILGGEPVFAGTRVPIKNLTDYLEAGETLDTFLDHFPSVSRDQAVAFLEAAREHMGAAAR